MDRVTVYETRVPTVVLAGADKERVTGCALTAIVTAWGESNVTLNAPGSSAAPVLISVERRAELTRTYRFDEFDVLFAVTKPV
jgi:hypothetical protein